MIQLADGATYVVLIESGVTLRYTIKGRVLTDLRLERPDGSDIVAVWPKHEEMFIDKSEKHSWYKHHEDVDVPVEVEIC